MSRLENFILVYVTCTIVEAAVNAANVKLSNLKCTNMDKSCGSFKSCSLKAVKRDVVELSTSYALAMESVDNATLVARLRKRGNSLQNEIYQFKINLCKFLRSDRRNPLASIFYTLFELKEYSNINHSCPYNHDIIVNRCRLNTKVLNILSLAPGEYTIFTSWYLYGKHAANVDVFLAVYD